MGDVKHEGVKITIGGEDFTFPALNFTAIKKFRPQLELMGTMDPAGMTLSDEQIDAFLAIIHASLSRNYPEKTIEDVADMIDLANVGRVVEAIMAVSGFVKGGATAGSGT